MGEDRDSSTVEPQRTSGVSRLAAPSGRRRLRSLTLVTVGAVIVSVILIVVTDNGSSADSRNFVTDAEAQVSPADAQDQSVVPAAETNVILSSGISSSPAITSSLLSVDPLPTNPWRSGEPAMAAALTGSIEEEPDGCLYINSFGTLQFILWPAGYARTGSGKDLQVLDSEGREVAKVGASVLVGGGNSSDSPIDFGCGAAKISPVFLVQSDVIVLESTPAGTN